MNWRKRKKRNRLMKPDGVQYWNQYKCMIYRIADRISTQIAPMFCKSNANNNIATFNCFSSAVSSGDRTSAISYGSHASAESSGDYASAGTFGECSTASASGNFSSAITYSEYSTAATSGSFSSAGTSGNFSSAATSGYRSSAISSGENSPAEATGYLSSATTSGNYSTASASCFMSSAATYGKDSIAVANGVKSRGKGAVGSYIVLTEYDETGETMTAKMEKVDGKHIKADTWYILVNGEFREWGESDWD